MPRSSLIFQSMKQLTFGLTLVRHGETRYNKEGLLQGQAIDCPLSEIGLQQAEAAGRYLKDVNFSNVFVSDMQRAQQTAETILKHSSRSSGLQMVCEPLLKEKSFGIAEGGRVQDFREMVKASGQSFHSFTPPEGETHEQEVKDVLFQRYLVRLHLLDLGLDVNSDLLHDQHMTMMLQIYKYRFDVSARRPNQGRLHASLPPLPKVLQVKERVKEFLEKMLLHIGANHWDVRGEDQADFSATQPTPPAEGKADDGVRGVPVHALVVTHGAYMCAAVRYFVEELGCTLPQGSDKAHVFSLSPNTGICRFLLTMRKEDDRFRLTEMCCVFVHRGDHVKQ